MACKRWVNTHFAWEDIRISAHFIREYIEDDILKLVFIRSEDNDSDIFTKNTNEDIFTRHSNKMIEDLGDT